MQEEHYETLRWQMVEEQPAIPVLRGPFRSVLLDRRVKNTHTHLSPYGAWPGRTGQRRRKETLKNQGGHHRLLSYEVSGCNLAGLCPEIIAAHRVGQS